MCSFGAVTKAGKALVLLLHHAASWDISAVKYNTYTMSNTAKTVRYCPFLMPMTS